MGKRIFFDIETLPPGEDGRERVARVVERELAGEGVLCEGEMTKGLIDQRFRDLALRGEYGRVLAIGVIIEENGQVVHHGTLGRDRMTRRFHLDEARTVSSFWRLIANFDARRDLFVGHNLFDFDLPFLHKRSIIHGVRPSVQLCLRRFQRQPVFDTMWEWTNWRERVRLDELAQALGIESPKRDDLDGSQVYDFFRAGRHEEIAEYCVRDTECARQIYYRLNFLDAPPVTRVPEPTRHAPDARRDILQVA